MDVRWGNSLPDRPDHPVDSGPLCRNRPDRELLAVASGHDHLVGDDQLVLGVHRL